MRLAPWGSPPTPLLPAWYRQNFADRALPDTFQALDPAIQTIGDLGTYWEYSDEPVTERVLRSLCHVVDQVLPPSDHLVVPAHTTRTTLHAYPLRETTKYWLGRAGLLATRQAITVGTLLQAPRVGRVKIIELMCVAELARSLTDPLATDSHARSASDVNVADPGGDPVQTHRSALIAAVIPLLSAAREFRGATTVADALRGDLSGLADILGITKDLEALPIQNLTRDPGIARAVVAKLDGVVASLSPSLKYVIAHRLLSHEPKTLDEIGRQRHISRQRVQQLHVEARRRIRHAVRREIDSIGRIIAESCPPVLESQQLDAILSATFPSPAHPRLSIKLARWALARKLDYSCCDGTCFNADARDVIAKLRARARSLADELELIHEGALRAVPPDSTWEPFFEVLSRQAGLHRLGARFSFRATLGVRVGAAIVEIGRPATPEEIAVAAGISLRQATTQLWRLPGVARADKKRWGLAAWIEDAYESISVAMTDRIRAAGGRVQLASLLAELPERFGVSESSVRSYANTPFFALKEGYVGIADDPLRLLKHLDEVISGRTHDGRPYWTFMVEEGHLVGRSVSGVPPEFALEMGCQPDGRAALEIDSPHEVRAASVIWRLTSTHGATVGRIREALCSLGATPGDRVRLVLNAPLHIELHLTTESGKSPDIPNSA